MKFGIVDYGVGNLASVANALRWVGRESRAVAGKTEFDDVGAIILPGVGAFGHAMAKLENAGFRRTLEDWVKAGKPLLGICLGMQLLSNGSSEHGATVGLGFVDAAVSPIEPGPGIRVPHMGWNEVVRTKDSVLFGARDAITAYHVHSYSLKFPDAASRAKWLVGTTTHGSEIVSVIEGDNVMGTQFHPEKSQKDGLDILANFCGHAERC
jgi:imidazole glycerol-phosphate synthase subunit HisH